MEQFKAPTTETTSVSTIVTTADSTTTTTSAPMETSPVVQTEPVTTLPSLVVRVTATIKPTSLPSATPSTSSATTQEKRRAESYVGSIKRRLPQSNPNTDSARPDEFEIFTLPENFPRSRSGAPMPDDSDEYDGWLHGLTPLPESESIEIRGTDNSHELEVRDHLSTTDFRYTINTLHGSDRRISCVQLFFNCLLVGFMDGKVVSMELPFLDYVHTFEQLRGPVRCIFAAEEKEHFYAVTENHIYYFQLGKPLLKHSQAFNNKIIGIFNSPTDHLALLCNGSFHRFSNRLLLNTDSLYSLDTSLASSVQVFSPTVWNEQYYFGLVQFKDYLAIISIDRITKIVNFVRKNRTHTTQTALMNYIVSADKIFIAPLYSSAMGRGVLCEIEVYNLNDLKQHRQKYIKTCGGPIVNARLDEAKLVVTTYFNFVNIFDTKDLQLKFLIEFKGRLQTALLFKNMLFIANKEADFLAFELPDESCDCCARKNEFNLRPETIQCCARTSARLMNDI
jgi:hypothetical protein